ncbi:MAG: hypothetical protein IKD69_10475 [Solobacterium sp.]|nr:hypothetical protein [Solobacterium sp.]
MLRIAISCGEGFSSGFLAQHLEQEVVKKGMEKDVSFIFIPFYQLEERQDEVDIAMIMPHIEPQIKDNGSAFRIPLYVVPFKVIVKPGVIAFIEDAEDILAMGRSGLVHFPGEERTQSVSRLISHREWAKNHIHA